VHLSLADMEASAQEACLLARNAMQSDRVVIGLARRASKPCLSGSFGRTQRVSSPDFIFLIPDRSKLCGRRAQALRPTATSTPGNAICRRVGQFVLEQSDRLRELVAKT
jgi:hypothetical protein